MKKVILSLLVLSGLATSHATETEKQEGETKVVVGSAGGSGAKDADLADSSPNKTSTAVPEGEKATKDGKNGKGSGCNLL